jgi:alpha-galactosidase
VLGAPGATCASIADRTNVCPWNPDNFGIDMDAPGAQEYYDSLAAHFADWGVDFIKLDDVLYPPVQTAEVAAFSRAIDSTGRPMVLSLSPGKQLSTAHLETLRTHAQLWRISDDLWDEWPQVREQFQRAARWAPLQQSGAWADADMLPFGRIGIRGHVGRDRISRLTVEEQRTVMTLWCLLRSPLMFGGQLPDTPAETLALLTRREVLALREGRDAGEIVRDGDLVIWRSQVGDRAYRALFWLGDEPKALRAHVDDLGVEAATLTGACEDAWSGETPTIDDGWVEVDVPAHGVRLLVFG